MKRSLKFPSRRHFSFTTFTAVPGESISDKSSKDKTSPVKLLLGQPLFQLFHLCLEVAQVTLFAGQR